MRRHHSPQFRVLPVWAAAFLLIHGLSVSAIAAPLTLSTAPAGNGGREPAPNIIVSVDDSGSMGADGIAELQAALTNAFSTTAVTDNTVRLAYQAMWRCRGFAASPYKNYGTVCPDNRMKPFSGTHRTNFNNWVNSLQAWSNTPSHLMIKNAGDYMKTTGLFNPFAKDPGITETPLLSCRKSFHIFMTDGEWNAETLNGNDPGTAGNADGMPRVFPDGTVYDPYNTDADPLYSTDTQTRIYRDPFGSNVKSTLSDYVFDQWATDLQPGIPNEVRPIIREPGVVNVGTVASPYSLQEYWNPKNDPATWQHLTTYTIGFHSAANPPISGATKHPWWGGSTWSNSGNSDYYKLIKGTVGWRDPITDTVLARQQELWHMAINSRGKFIPASSAAALSAAFAEIVNQILIDTSSPLVSIAANTQSVQSSTRAYVAGYDASKWSGSVRAYGLAANGSVNQTVLWDAATQLEAVTPSARLIYTHNGTSPTVFNWGNISVAQQALLQGTDTATIAQGRLDYLRGDRTQEVQSGGGLRNRDKRLGDIVDSALWTVGQPEMGYTMNNYRTFRANNAARTPMLYVGANDGMLHGFSTNDGNEKIAYVPLGVYGNLSAYTDPAYVHRFFVDGQPFTGDFWNGSAWQTALVGSLAGGGKGYFVLDVTDPGSWTPTSAASVVINDKTDGADADIGNIYGEPTLDTGNTARAVQITKLNNGRWAALMGNGVNSSNEKAVLLIQYLDGDKSLLKLVADNTTGGGNGLSNPQVIDFNGDGTADVAYAGDMKGNLWKFDLTRADPNQWGLALTGAATPSNTPTTSVPLFVTRDTAGTRQPITTAPTWAAHPNGGVMLAFGTGRLVTEADRTDTSLQTLYAIWDNAAVSPGTGIVSLTGGSAIADTSPGFGRSSLVQQTQTSTLTISGQTFFKTSTNAVPYVGAGSKRGWYLDWPGVGERTVANGGLVDKRLMFMRSKKPAVGSLINAAEETCTPNATPNDEYLTLIDILTGKPLSTPAFDTDGGGFTGTEELGVSRWKTGSDDRLWLRAGRSDGKNNESISVSPRTNDVMRIRSGAIQPARIGWRQLQ